MKLKLDECEDYRYDPAAAERPIRFIERHLKHYEGEFAGKPFLLMDWQKEDVLRPLFGWIRRDNGKRRFRELWFEGGKGLGKTPLITGIALYLLFGDKEPGAQIISLASNFRQASDTTFELAKKYIRASETLSGLASIKQYRIFYPKTQSEWLIMSGTGEGAHGYKPTCLCGDEIHEWQGRKLFDNITSNMHKRAQPLTLLATNAGSTKEGVAWDMHEMALKVMEGKSQVKTLLPVIYTADEKQDWTSAEVWQEAIPSLGETIKVENLAAECVKAKESPRLEAKFRRLYLTQWIQGADRWLDATEWEACAVGFAPRDVKGLPCYTGLDLSQNDDISSLVSVWVGPARWFVRQNSWIPRETAERYEARDGTPYREWADAGRLTLLDSTTVDEVAKRRIARRILKRKENCDLRALCYDRRMANDVISRVEKKGVTCFDVQQGFWLSPACKELERRLRSKTIVFEKDGLFAWMAGNVEVATDSMGNVRIVKQAAKGKYQGTRASKIDAVASLVNAISQILRDQMGGGLGQGARTPVTIEFYD